MLPQKYTVQFFVSFYKQESDVQDHDDPQVLKGVLKCTHSFTEWTLGDVYYVPDTVPFTSVCCFVWSSHYPHLTGEKTRGSERLNDLSKFRKPDSGRTGFWTSVWFQSSYTDSFNAPCCLPWQKSLTSYYGASRKVWLPTMVLGIHENDATYTAEPRDEDDFSWDKGQFQGLWASFVQPCLHVWPWKGERDLPEGRHITTKQRLGLQGPPELPLESPSWV